MKYKCLECEDEHSVDNVAPVCAFCFDGLKFKLKKIMKAIETIALVAKPGSLEKTTAEQALENESEQRSEKPDWECKKHGTFGPSYLKCVVCGEKP